MKKIAVEKSRVTVPLMTTSFLRFLIVTFLRVHCSDCLYNFSGATKPRVYHKCEILEERGDLLSSKSDTE